MASGLKFFMKFLRISNVFLSMAFLLSCGPAASPSNLGIEDGWVRAMPPGMKMTAAYGIINNQGSDSVEIVSFSSDSFATVSLHRSLIVNGVTKMEPLPLLKLDGGAVTVLKPGGLHLMLENPIGEISPGHRIGLTLKTASGETFQFSIPVEAR